MQASTSRLFLRQPSARITGSSFIVSPCWFCENTTSIQKNNAYPSSIHDSTTITSFEQRRFASAKGKAAPKQVKKGASFAKKGGKKSQPGLESGGERMETLKQYLYGNDATARRAHELERIEALNKAIPNVEVHETIMRAWQLHQRKARETRESEMNARYESMQEALEELKNTSTFLFREATEVSKFNTVRGTKGEAGKQASIEGRIPGLFPRQMAVLG